MAENKSPKVGLALSGGGALGYAHIGFLQAMKEYHFDVDVVSGTSMGSIIGALYCAGFSPIEILELVDKENMNRVLSIVRFSPSFGKGFFVCFHIFWPEFALRKIAHFKFPIFVFFIYSIQKSFFLFLCTFHTI